MSERKISIFGRYRSNDRRNATCSRISNVKGVAQIANDDETARDGLSENSRSTTGDRTSLGRNRRSKSSNRGRQAFGLERLDRRLSHETVRDHVNIKTHEMSKTNSSKRNESISRIQQNFRLNRSTECLNRDFIVATDKPNTTKKQQSNFSKRSKRQSEVKHRNFSYCYLKELLKKNTSEKILNIIDPHNGLEECLSSSNLSVNMTANLLDLFSSIFGADLHLENQMYLMNLLLAKDFLTKHLSAFVREISLGKTVDYDINEICLYVSQIMDSYLLRYPQIAAEELLPSVMYFTSVFRKLQQIGDLTDIRGIQSLTNFQIQAEDFLEKQYEEAKKKSVKKIDNTTVEEPPDCFRNIPIVPTTLEITTRMKPFLRPNIVVGTNKDVDDYLDRQFRLLREDFVSPLREGITEYLLQVAKNSNQKKFNDIRIYKNVKIHPLKQLNQNNDGFSYVLEFDLKPFGKLNWELSRRLIYGSLLCLSSNNFQSVILATVADRKIDELKKGRLSVRFEGKEFEEITLSKDQEKHIYIMAESQAYFEAYRHILKALQSIDPQSLPFKKYIIDLQKSPTPPLYLTEEEFFLHYDLSEIMNEFLEERGETLVNVHRLSTWPSAKSLNLDSSQLQAVQFALSSEISIIQGPPGTGKTYVGLKIVAALLKNKHMWNAGRKTPILVICYTNHALDQFLEGILPFTRSLLRIGGRSKNVALEKYNLNSVRNRIKTAHAREDFIHYNLSNMKTTLSKLRFQLENFDEKQNLIMQGILHEDSLRELPSPHNELVESLNSGFRDNFQIDANELPFYVKSLLASWLGLMFENLVSEEELFEFYENDEGDFIPVNAKQLNRVVAAEAVLEQDVKQIEEIQDVEELIEIENEVQREEENRRLLDAIDFEDLLLKDYGRNTNAEEEIILALQVGDLENPKKFLSQEEIKLSNGMIEPMVEVRKCIFQREIEKFDIMDDSEITNVTNVWHLKLSDRWRLYRTWKKLKFEQLNEKIKDLQDLYTKECRRLQEVKNGEDLLLMQNSDVIGMTTTGAARYHNVLHEIGPRIIIVEEAAEVLEAHITAALTPDTQQLILIGDHKQLRPNPTVYKLAKDFNLEISMFERLIQNGVRFETLELQHRMRPEISCLLVPHIYPNLRDHSSVLKYENIKGVRSNVFFLNHSFLEEQVQDSQTKANKFEAEYIIKLCRHLLWQGYDPSKITILTTYAGQLFTIRNLLKKSIFEGVQLTVVDNFQGEENDIILLSFVRSNDEGRIGFLSIENRVCVALSRAKKALFCVGNFHLFAEKSDVWRKIVSVLERSSNIGQKMPLRCERHQNIVVEVANAADFDRLSPEGGCFLPCSFELPCGHVCPRVCHTGNHLNQKCLASCENIICILGHKCPKQCFEECGKCFVKVMKKLPNCDHDLLLPCWKDESTVQCQEIVKRTLPTCNHMVKLFCHIDVFTYSCVEQVEKELSCGHWRDLACHKDPKDANCLIDCDYRLDCGHQCYKKCHIDDDPEHLDIQCKKPCPKKCERNHGCKQFCYQPCEKCMIITPIDLPCGHTEMLPCSSNPDTVKCKQSCARKLSCGHPCLSPCYVECNHETCNEIVPRILPSCGHTMIVRCGDPLRKILCSGKCEKRLPCGHQCQNLCSQLCNRKCEALVSANGQCGHEMKVPCGKRDDLPELLQRYCKHRCQTLLPCEHLCSGSCGDCRQGRLHIGCQSDCGRPQICGHICKGPCAKNCPPCKEKCPAKCVHSRCPKKCGIPCKKCNETCAWACSHFQCSKKCWEECNRPRCNEPCRKTLRCGHPCVGLCGERCPKLCRICHAEEMTTILLGNEKDPDARFIQLEDCSHCIEVEGLDKWMDMDQKEIKMKECPLCKTVIWRSSRYGNIIKKCFADVRKIKKQHFGHWKHQYSEMKKVLGMLEITNLKLSFREQYNLFFKSLTGRWALSNSDLAAIQNKINILVRMDKLKEESKKMSSKVQKSVEAELQSLCQNMMDRGERVNEYFMDQMNHELNRLGLLAAFFQAEEEYPTKAVSSNVIQTDLLRLKNLFSSGKTLDDNEGSHKVGEMWRSSGLQWTDFLSPQQNLQDFIREKKMEFTVSQSESHVNTSMPMDRIKADLDSLLKKHKNDNEAIYDWIAVYVGPAQIQEAAFVRALVTAVCESAIIAATEKGNYRVDDSVIRLRSTLLHKYLDQKEEMELQALYALQALMHRMEHPTGILRQLFEIFYDTDIISEDGFIQWNINNDPAEQEGRGVAASSVQSFFTWLQEAEESIDDES